MDTTNSRLAIVNTTSSAPAPPSSPPVVKYDSIVDRERPQSSSSSALPPPSVTSDIAHLPAPRAPRTPASARSRDRSSDYYTAIWGSPYDVSPTATRSAHTAFSEQPPSDDFEESSLDPRFALEHLIPSRLSDLSFPEPPVVLPLATAGLSNQNVEEPSDDLVTPRSRTQRWVQLPQADKQPTPSEKGRWWSNEAALSLSEHKRQRKRAASSIDSSHIAEQEGSRGHKSREANRTLDQQSFWEILREQRTDDMSSLFASRWAATPPPDPKPESEQVPPSPLPPKDADAKTEANGEGDNGESGILDKENVASDPQKQEDARPEPPNQEITPAQSPLHEEPLPKVLEKDDENAQPPPAEEAAVIETPTVSLEKPLPRLPSPEKPTTVAPLKPETPQPSDPTRLEPPRLKKRVSWRGKNIVISIPRVDFEAVGLPMPMSRSEIQERLKQFEDAGYSTRGFDLAEDVQVDGEQTQVRPIYPLEAETRTKPSNRDDIKVVLPDLEKWKAYQDWLTEQKLAALGVTLGLDEPTPSQDMSRQSSGQYPPLPFSPPIPTASAASMGRPAMVRGHSHNMSVASPASPFGHMQRNSIFTGAGFPGMQTISPQQFGIPGIPNAPSPGPIAALRQDFNNSRGPGSPLNQQVLPESTLDYSRVLADDQRNRQQIFSQNGQMPPLPPPFGLQNANVRPTPMLPELPEDDDEEELEEEIQSTYVPPQKRVQANTEIAVPTPRGHRHNISEGLERDLLEAEHWQNNKSKDWADDVEEVEGPPPTKKQNANGIAEPPKPAPVAERDPLGQNYVVQEAKHNRKKSGMTRFNVAAPVFTFNPSSAEFHPPSGAFTFGAAPMPKMNGTGISNHVRNTSSGSFNAAAPAFKPSSFTPTQSTFSLPETSFEPQKTTFVPLENPVLPAQDAAPSVPTSDFSFSAAVPMPAADTTASSATSANGENSIFGKVEIPDIVKPARRSKAIAIVHPEERKSTENSATEFEDETGRIAQSDAKRKQRKFDDDGDSVPQFAQPNEATSLPPPPVEKILGSNAEVPPPAEEKAEPPLIEGLDEDPREVAAKSHPEAKKQEPLHMHNRHSGSLSALAKPFEPVFSPKKETVSKSQSEERFSSLSELEEGEIREDEENDASPVRKVPQPAGSHVAEPAKPGEPSFDEIDAVMRQLNGDEATEDAAGSASPVRLPSPGSHPMKGVTYIPEWSRSDAPSPSPRRRQAEAIFNAHQRNESVDRDVNGWSHVTRLNKAEDAPMSDWSGILSPPDEAKLPERSKFFDSHIDKIVGRVMEQRLRPLEESLRNIHTSVARRNHSADNMFHRTSSNVESDADDEDDLSDGHRKRPISRGRDRRLDQIKAAVAEALRDQSPKRTQMSNEVAELHSVLADMKVSFARAASASLEIEEIRAVVEDALTRQSQALVPANDGEDKESHKQAMGELEGRLNQTLASALEEANLRRTVEEREAESRRLLRLAEEELSLLRDNARDDSAKMRAMEEERGELLGRLEKSEETVQSFRDVTREENLKRETMEDERQDLLERLERSQRELQSFQDAAREENPRVRSLEEEREDLLHRLDKVEDSHSSTKDQLKDAEAENEALTATLSEYRASSNKWRQEIEEGKRERETLEHEISILERQADDNQEASGSMKRRLEKIHADMATATGQLASEKAMWKAKEEHYRARYDALEAQQAVFNKERGQIEEELSAARVGAAEAHEYRKTVEQMRSSNNALDEAVRKLRAELTEQQALAARYERQFHDAQEAGRAEVHRTRMSMETDIEAANHQVNIVRAELESELTRVRAELETSRMEADSAKATHEHLLEQEENARREALRKVNHANSVALDEARHKYETSIQEMTSQHNRALQHAREDKERSESFLNQRLTLSDAKLQHFQDRVQHLEERLEVAKSAAQAAAMSAKTSKTTAAPAASARLPEKISPQALRESILVLQEQLQERETRIERLQSQVEREGPAKLKERDTEIAWLRELLSVRSEELGDLVNTLSQPSFNRDAVRDTAIRIQANLQMEQQEKERFGRAPQSVGEQALASISNFASPRAAQFTSAFNKWRANMESSSLKASSRPGPSRSYTPSKAPTAPRPSMYSSGLMTPPASNLRSSPAPDASASLPPPRLHPRTGSQSSKLSHESRSRKVSSERPTTPLFREQSYDEDAAEDNSVQMQAFEDDDLDVADSEPPAFRSLEDELDGSDDANADA